MTQISMFARYAAIVVNEWSDTWYVCDMDHFSLRGLPTWFATSEEAQRWCEEQGFIVALVQPLRGQSAPLWEQVKMQQEVDLTQHSLPR